MRAATLQPEGKSWPVNNDVWGSVRHQANYFNMQNADCQNGVPERNEADPEALLIMYPEGVM